MSSHTRSLHIPKAFGVDMPQSWHTITAICPGCKHATATVDRVGNTLYGDCPCGWEGSRRLSAERM